jgi:hypothetical protein
MIYILHDESLTLVHSTQQDPDRPARRAPTVDQTDELQQRRGAM